MDKNITVEGNYKRSDLTLVSKSGVALIESRPSELDNAAEKYMADKCGHFTIRGYVAEVRRKNSKICWPFPNVGNHNKLEEQTLPPLHVPKFRWWHCQNCLRMTDSSKDTPIETGAVTNCCNSAHEKNTISSPGIPSTLSCGDGKKLHSGFQKSSEVNDIVDGRKSSSDVSLHVNDKHLPGLFETIKEKGAEVVLPIMEGKNMNLAICRSAYSLKKVDICLAGVNFTKEGTFSTNFQIGKKGCDISSSDIATATPSKSHEKRALETVIKSKGYELVTSNSEIFQKETETLKSKGDELVNSSKEIFHTQMPEFSRTNLAQINVGHEGIATSSVISAADKETSNAVVCRTRNLHSLVSIDSSSESDDNLAGEDVRDQHHASRCGNSGDTSHGSKPRKLCLLTDIIRREVLATSNKLHYTERDAKIDHRKTEGTQPKATPEASPGKSVYPVTNNQVSFQGTDKKVMLGKQKKCELPQDQDGGSSRMNRQRGGTENIKSLEEDPEIGVMDTINADGEVTGNASFPIRLHLGSKSFLDKQRNDRKLIPAREKKKMSQVEDSLFSLAPHQDRSSNKILTRKDAEIQCVGSELVPFESFQDAVAGKDLNLGAQFYVATQQKGKKLALDDNKNKVPRVEGEKSSIMPWQEGMSHKDLIIKRNLDRKHNKGAPSDSLNSLRIPSRGKVDHRGLKHHMLTHRKATLNKRQKNLPQVECRVTIPGSESVSSLLICQPKGSSNACNYENIDDIKEPSKLSMDRYDQMANNMCEQEASDDIPMEIVELMARNQYERCLDYAKDATENRYCLSETTEKEKDTGITDSTEALGKEMLRLLHEKPNLQKSLPSNAKYGIGSGPSGAATKQKSDYCLSTAEGESYSINFSTTGLEQGQAYSGFEAFPEHQGKVPSQVPFPVIDSRRCCTENCSCGGELVGHSCFNTSVQSFGTYQTSQAILPQSSQSIWSAVPCQMPFESNIPQKLVPGVNIPDRLSQFPDPLPKGSIDWDHTLTPLNPEASHLQKKKGGSAMESNKGAHPEYLFACTDKGNVYHQKMRGPLDLYTNETVSAMHLLRLMHAGVSSSTPVNMNNNREGFLKDPSFPHDQIINESPGTEANVSKTNGASVSLSSCDHGSKIHHLGKSCERFPPFSVGKAVGSLVQKDVSSKRTTMFTDGFLGNALPGALRYQEMGDKKRSYSPARTRGPKLHMSASRNSHTSENHEGMICNQQKGFLLLTASDSRQCPEQSHTAGGSTKHVELKVSRKDGTVSLAERISGIESCTLNRNPAEFTVPKARNVYMIGAGQLKRKLTSSRERGGPINVDVHKRPKKMKLTTIEEHEQILSFKKLSKTPLVVPPCIYH